jgi:hypothetical protein
MPDRYYHFKGKNEEIINSVLSLLLGKEYYQENSYYSNFINESQSPKYRKKVQTILNLMQKENLILIRENTEASELQPLCALENMDKKETSVPTGHARIHLRQHGKQVLSEGGYSQSLNKKSNPAPASISFDSKLAIIVIFITGILCGV